MPAVNFGAGTLVGRRTGVSNPTPSFFGILQEVDITVDRTLKELIGNYSFASDVAPAQMKITGSAKFAQITASALNDMMFGMSLSSTSGFAMAIGENKTIPGTPYQVTVSNAANFKEDLGVFYAATGVQLARVASTPATGQYAVNESTGVYTFASGDTTLGVNIYYSYNVTTMKQISMTNPLMGVGPTFEIYLYNTYTDNSGTLNTFGMKLNACRSSKLQLPLKNQDYTIESFDFTAYADAANAIGSIVTGA